MTDRFSAITVWEGQTFSFERLAWLKVQGIPLHLLTNEFIDLVGGLFGMIVHKANRSERDRDLSFEYVGVLVGDGKRISEEIMLNWKNRRFRILVMEELGDWVPDFVKVKNVQEDDGSVNSEMEEEDAGDSDSDSDAVPDVPDDVSDVSPENDEVIIINVEYARMETHDCSINDIDDVQSSVLKERNLNEGTVNDVFTPAVNFDFDQSFDKCHNSPPASKISKRKKV
ncbi:hypothetical protein Hanom_Chr07g00609431 [Helianthus anomalus]